MICHVSQIVVAQPGVVKHSDIARKLTLIRCSLGPNASVLRILPHSFTVTCPKCKWSFVLTLCFHYN
jgi:hypothetical protein